jgi:hypothetical protein
VLRASQGVLGADFRKHNGCCLEAGQRRRGGLYGDELDPLAVVLSRIVGVMIADPGTATTPVENATGRESCGTCRLHTQ